MVACYSRNVAGRLYVIATPLGNLEDLSERARRTLSEVDRIVCEDTRRTARLLARFDIDTPRLSCHRFNEAQRLSTILEELQAGGDVALVSDAGTPGIADPGALLVTAAREAGITVVPIPGPSAPATLLSVSGLSADRYVFDGYLPHRAGERRRRLRTLAGEERPVVLFETPHRIRETLADIEAILGDRPLVLGRELTKIHESLLHGSAAELAAGLPDPVRGEFVMVLTPATDGAEVVHDSEARQLEQDWHEALESEDGDTRRAIRRLARERGMRRDLLSRRLAELGLL